MLMYVYAYYLCLSMLNISQNFGKNYNGGPINQDGGSTSITHGSQNWNRVNDFHFVYCVNHTRFALAKRLPQNSLWYRKPSPPNSKNKKRKPSPSPRHKNPHPARYPLGPSGTFPIHTCTSSSASMPWHRLSWR